MTNCDDLDLKKKYFMSFPKELTCNIYADSNDSLNDFTYRKNDLVR